MDSLRKNKTWELVDHPAGQKRTSCKWLFKIKEGIEDVQKPRYKSRLVARGFTQRAVIDYNEVFSPVVRHTSIRVILALTACKDYELEQLDVKTAFLHKNLEEHLLLLAQPHQDPYYQTSKSHKSYAPTSKTSLTTISHATTRHKVKEIAKPITPSSESASKEDSDHEQAQKDKEIQKNLALIAKLYGGGSIPFQLKSDSLPHAHTQTTKTNYKHQDSRIKKAQDSKTKTFANSDIQDLPSRYQVYQGRLLASFLDDAKYEHVGQDTRSQGGKDDQD
ncbi:retrovirus-related pol polyprotein from transposon TNT 1-94 [Tanacetum coccineum]